MNRTCGEPCCVENLGLCIVFADFLHTAHNRKLAAGTRNTGSEFGAVALQDTLIRFSLMATHTQTQLDYALEAIRKVFKKHDLIP